MRTPPARAAGQAVRAGRVPLLPRSRRRDHASGRPALRIVTQPHTGAGAGKGSLADADADADAGAPTHAAAGRRVRREAVRQLA
ncbi:hypothetical protein ACIQU6_18920 [Streptomyces sp. NPDC090442]|uniref:hypothetical protein n=1 Tax=Streptomyces sp. NPDC090442 TaxID=3365962 RepID=UPI0037F688A7